MKRLSFFACMLLLTVNAALAQQFRPVDKSPRGIAWYPDHFAHDRKEGDKALVKVVYSRPGANNREVFGKLVPYGKVWRTGADEATEIRFYQDATFGGKKVKAGSYSLFTIPGEKEWTIILNADLDYWGAYKYRESADVLRVTVPSKTTTTPVENFSVVFDKGTGKETKMYLGWATTVVEVPISF
ncbi:DUF2911 domain-containing protein [Dyadobacter sandarakinus]|uniref:DUF2911 domain-containing protein n=1 Tax=Dyadobacter sandarakinus TaxID=2747268 RepID=A0ABX7IFM6_9BACT|nr:DUF2911 domain-containing protein [Dyadobacter sandarakinus]QRR03651.1 DUF2911 domain-containing protein [Dyadobacter sandarakinus]